MIATALACRPRLLLADEPTTGLDVTLTRDILELFRAVADEQDRGVLLVSHDIASIAEFCDRLVVLYAGSVVEDRPDRRGARPPGPPVHADAARRRARARRQGRSWPRGGSMPLLARRPHGVPVRPALQPRRRRPAAPTARCSSRAGDGRAVACFHPLDDSARARRRHGRGRRRPAERGRRGERRGAACRDADVRVSADASAPRPTTRCTASASRSAAARRSASSARAAAARRRWPAVLVGLVRPRPGSRRGRRHRRRPRRARGRAAAASTPPCRWCSRTRSARSARAAPPARRSREPMIAAGLAAAEQERRLAALVGRVGLDDDDPRPTAPRAVRRPGAAGRHRPRAVGGPRRRRVRRTDVGARRDRAGADPRARRPSWRRAATARTCSSPTISPSSARCATASPCSTSAASSSRAPTAEVFALRCTPTPGPCSPARRSLDRGRRGHREASASLASSTTTTRARRLPAAAALPVRRRRVRRGATVGARARRAGWSPAGAPTRSTPAPPCPSSPAPPPPFTGPS